MNKKKVSALLVAGVLSVGAIGSTLAWFTSQDRVTNAFQTGDTNKPGESDSGIDIEEEFDTDHAENVLPGDSVTKEVKVTNTASYKQLIRAKIEKVWKNSEGEIVTHYVLDKVQDDQGNDVKTVEYLTQEQVVNNTEALPLDKSLIILNLSNDEKWINNNDANLGVDGGYYYYNDVVESNGSTSNLLEKVTLSGKANNVYKNLNFDVIVTAEGVQATNNAVRETWTTAPDSIKALGN